MLQGVQRRLVHRRFRRGITRIVRPGEFKSYGPGSIVHPPLAVDHRECVTIGERTFILSGASLWLGGADAELRIGSGTYLGRDLTIHCGASVVIGDDVMGSDRLLIADVEYVPSPRGYAELSPARQVIIEDGVFLGTGAIVMPGVTIGARSLVAAGAVVTQDAPPNTVVAGNPARVVRHYDADADTWVSGPPRHS